MLDALPGHIGDVQQTVDAAQVEKRTVVSEILDDSLEHQSVFETFQQGFALGAVFRLDHGAP